MPVVEHTRAYTQVEHILNVQKATVGEYTRGNCPVTVLWVNIQGLTVLWMNIQGLTVLWMNIQSLTAV